MTLNNIKTNIETEGHQDDIDVLGLTDSITSEQSCNINLLLQHIK